MKKYALILLAVLTVGCATTSTTTVVVDGKERIGAPWADLVFMKDDFSLAAFQVDIEKCVQLAQDGAQTKSGAQYIPILGIGPMLMRTSEMAQIRTDCMVRKGYTYTKYVVVSKNKQ